MKLTPRDRIESHCRRRGYPAPVRELVFAAPIRQWRFDLSWPELMLAIEIEGGAFTGSGKPCPVCKQPRGGRHNSGPGMRKDLEKYAEAVCRGWRLLRVMPEQTVSGQALGWLSRLMEQELARRKCVLK